MKLKLYRYKRTDRETLSVLIGLPKVFYVLEPSWHNNQRNISCIPAGQYQCNYLAKSASGKYKNCFHVTSVKNRLGILIHNGNIYKHTKGCLILGLRTGILASNNAVLNSRTALRQFSNFLNKRTFSLEVVDGLVG